MDPKNKLIIYKMGNGIKTYIKELDSNINYCHFAIVIKSGSLSDKKNFGEAHFLEHILLEFDRQKLYSNIKYKIKGTTSLDKTIFMLSCENKDIDRIIILLQNIISGKYLKKENIENVRLDVINEYNREVLNNRAYSLMYKELLSLSKISNSIPIGNINSIKKIKYNDLVKYFKQNYVSENIAILCIGNFNCNKIFKKILKNFDNNLIGKHLFYNIEKKKNNFPNRIITSESHINVITPNIETIHIFVLKNFENEKDFLIESIITTFIHEILNFLLNDSIYDVKIEINQLCSKGRFIHIILFPNKHINDLSLYIKYFCSKILNYLENKQYYKLLDEIFAEYYTYFSLEEVNSMQYINQMIDNFLYEKPIYNNNSEVIKLLEKISNKEVIFNTKRIIENVMLNTDTYLFQIKD